MLAGLQQKSPVSQIAGERNMRATIPDRQMGVRQIPDVMTVQSLLTSVRPAGSHRFHPQVSISNPNKLTWLTVWSTLNMQRATLPLLGATFPPDTFPSSVRAMHVIHAWITSVIHAC